MVRQILAICTQLIRHVKSVLLLRGFEDDLVALATPRLTWAREQKTRIAQVQRFQHSSMQHDHARSAAPNHLCHAVRKRQRVVRAGHLGIR